jgi:hypothetical protein
VDERVAERQAAWPQYCRALPGGKLDGGCPGLELSLELSLGIKMHKGVNKDVT